MDEHEQMLTEALEKAVRLVETVEKEHYREAAFPIILQALIGTVAIPPATETLANPNTPIEEPPPLRVPFKQSVQEFFVKAKPDSHIARFACAAYYLLQTGKEQFSTLDIISIYGRLRVAKPVNPADTMAKTLRKGYITEADATSVDNQKLWVITPTGEQFVESLLIGELSSDSLPTDNLQVAFMSSVAGRSKAKPAKGGSRVKRRTSTTRTRRAVSNPSA